jgi:Tfp pilus assembly protein PilN
MTTTTLRISNRDIKVLAVKGRRVKKWGSLAVPDGTVKDGLVQQPQVAGEAIASLFKSAGIPKERVIVSISGMSFTYRFIKMPKMKPSQLDEAIRRAVKKEISLPLDELYLSWQDLPGKDDEPTYFVLGVPRHFVDALAKTLKIAGIEPYLMDLQPLALARAAGRPDAIVVNLEPDCFDIVFIAGGFPAVIHSISPRGEGATLEDNIMRLAGELTKTAAFYESRHPEGALSSSVPLLLTGGLTLDTPVRALLQAEVKYQVESVAPPLDYPPELPVPSYTVNLGLALKRTKTAAGSEAGFHDIDINIFADKYRKIRRKPTPAVYIIAQAFLAVAIVALFPLYQSIDKTKDANVQIQTEFTNISRELSLATLFAAEDALTENEIIEINAATAALRASDQSLTAGRGVFTRHLETVTGALPASVDITSLEINSTTITVRGETGDVFRAVEYAVALEQTGMFREVRISELGETTRAVIGDDAGGEPTVISLVTFAITINK